MFSVGDALGPLVKDPIEPEQLRLYAEASGDFNPIHLDEAFAKQAGLGGVIAHGMLSMGFLGQLLTDLVYPNGKIRGKLQTFGVRFLEMVRPGDVVTCTGTITAVTEDDHGQTVECQLSARTAMAEVLRGTARFTMPLLSQEGKESQG